MSNVAQFTDENFEVEVLQSELPVLVDFWAPWCGPCRQIGPVIDQLAAENAGKVKIGKVNTDENPDVSQRYQVFTIPTLVVFKGGEVVDRFGPQSKAAIQKTLDGVKG
ncbi:MAG: thioredoxin [Planctomycetes bacterium]|jgi:thioredoxin 1|nr:thioredoxin [Planctomycetota bacterium]